MIRFVDGDMWARPADIRVNTVNCVGVMGKGVARQFADRYPKMLIDYRGACRRGEVQPGRLHFYWVDANCLIINFPTKRHWQEQSRYAYIIDGLKALRFFLAMCGRSYVTLPALGCGNGGLDWEKVKMIIETELRNLDAEIFVYSPNKTGT